MKYRYEVEARNKTHFIESEQYTRKSRNAKRVGNQLQRYVDSVHPATE